VLVWSKECALGCKLVVKKGGRGEPRGYRGTREVGKKKEKRIPWGEALEPARAGRAALKFESGHGPERKIALSISLSKNRRNVVNFDAAMTANEGEERRDPTENEKCDSRGGIFLAFVGV
jgi:hypothetical protein